MRHSLPLRIVVDKKVLQAFIRRAKQAVPNEYIESLWGTISGDTVYLHAFIPIEHKGTPGSVDYDDGALREALEDTKGMRWLGSCHSHPSSPAVPSEADWESARDEVEQVMGILEIRTDKCGRKRTKIQFWPVVRTLRLEYGRG